MSKRRLYYRCRYAHEYAATNKIQHPRNIFLAEQYVLEPLDEWLANSLDPNRLSGTIDAMFDAQLDLDRDPAVERAAQVIEVCDGKLARYRETLDTGTDPQIFGRWIAETQATRTAAMAQARRSRGRTRITKDEIRGLVEALGNLRCAGERRPGRQGRGLQTTQAPAHLRTRQTDRQSRSPR